MSVPQACRDPTCGRLGIAELSAKLARRLLRLRPRLTPALRARHRRSDDGGGLGARIACLLAVAGFVMTLGLSAAPPAQASSYAVTQVPGFTSIALLTGIGSGGDGGVWSSDLEYPNGGGPVAYLTRIDPASLALSRTAINPAPTDNGQTLGVAADPGGATWFTRPIGNAVSRINPDGSITDFPLPTPLSAPGYIHEGPDGAMWFIESRGTWLGRLDSNGSLTEFPVTNFTSDNFTVGSDGNFWLAVRAGQVLKVSTSGQILASYAVPDPAAITTGSDGALWVTSDGTNSIFRVTTNGAISQYTLPGASRSPDDPGWITSGTDGALWFTETNTEAIGRMTTDGTLTDEIPLPTGTTPVVITTVGNAVWFSEQGGLGPGVNGVGKIDTSASPPPVRPPPVTPPPVTPPLETPHPATVIVPGLDTYVHAVDATTPSGCGTEPLHVYCEKLTGRGQRVLVVPSTGPNQWLDVHDGFIDGNARLLDQFVRYQIAHNQLDSKPLLVGHSMGGVIARVAVARYGTPARGVVAVGAPETGSYWADSYTTWTVLSGTTAKFGLSPWDLTTQARKTDNTTLAGLPIPTHAIAGNADQHWSGDGDGVVYVRSACAPIGGDRPCTVVPDIHMPSTFLDFGWAGVRGVRDLEADPVVASAIADIADGGEPPTLGTRAAIRSARTTITAQASIRPGRTASKHQTLALQFEAASSIPRSAHTLISTRRAPLFAKQRFGVRCGSEQATAVQLIPGVYYLPAGAMKCASGRLTGKARTIISIGSARGLHGKVAFVKSNVNITISGHGLRSASVRVGKHSYSGHHRGRTITIVVPLSVLAKHLGIASAVVAQQRVSAAITIPA
jgi:streptogramin lyase/pimeloyl-ACP methyl ester carboxylesterase